MSHHLLLEDSRNGMLDIFHAYASLIPEVLRVTVEDSVGESSVFLTLKQAEQLKQFLNENF